MYRIISYNFTQWTWQILLSLTQKLRKTCIFHKFSSCLPCSHSHSCWLAVYQTQSTTVRAIKCLHQLKEIILNCKFGCCSGIMTGTGVLEYWVYPQMSPGRLQRTGTSFLERWGRNHFQTVLGSHGNLRSNVSNCWNVFKSEKEMWDKTYQNLTA